MLSKFDNASTGSQNNQIQSGAVTFSTAQITAASLVRIIDNLPDELK